MRACVRARGRATKESRNRSSACVGTRGISMNIVQMRRGAHGVPRSATNDMDEKHRIRADARDFTDRAYLMRGRRGDAVL